MQYMQEVSFGRKTAANQVTVVGSTTWTELLPHNTNRIAIVISSSVGATITLSFRDVPTGSQGISIPTASMPLILNVKDHGDMVTHRIMARVDVGSVGLNAWYCEVILPSNQPQT